MKDWFVIPRWKESLLLLIFAAAYLFLHGPGLGATDPFLAYPITSKFQDPALYSEHDLLIQAGISGTFLFYELLGHVSWFADNFVLRDLVFGIPFFLLYLFAWYNLFFELSKNRMITFVSLFFVLFADGKFGLHWSAPAVSGLYSITLVHFLQIFALLFFLRKKLALSFSLMSLTTYFHPASGMVYLSVMGALLVFESIRERNIRLLIKPFVYSVLIMAPNVLMLQNGIAPIDKQTYFNIFKTFQTHAYLADHYKEGYLYTLAVFVLVVINRFKHIIALEHRKVISDFIIIGFIGAAVWLINVYFIQNISVVYTFFITRIFYVLRPLLILFTLLTAQRLWEQKVALFKIIAVFLLASLIEFMSFGGMLIVLPAILLFAVANTKHIETISFTKWKYALGAFVALAYGTAVYERLLSGNLLEKILAYEWLAVPFAWVSVFFAIAVILIISAIIFRKRISVFFSRFFPDASNFSNLSKQFMYPLVLVCVCVLLKMLVFYDFNSMQIRTLEKSRNYGYDVLDPAYSALLDWAKQYKGKMFIVPPYDNNFGTFRYLAHNSVYVHQGDINQLMYSPVHYEEAFNRMKELGMNILKRRTFDWSVYNGLSIEYLKDTDSDFAIFEKKTDAYTKNKEGHEPVYENEKYVVYALK